MGKSEQRVDIVYILKNNIDPYELTYSLRSLVNFPHGKVWIYGGEPEGIKADSQVTFEQEGRSKWEKVSNSIRKICENEEITSDFWLFNDDFFCMKKCDGIPAIYNGTLYDRIREIVKRHGVSEYSRRLNQTAAILRGKGLPVRNYAVHMPMLINREKALEVLDSFYGSPMFRSLYGNYCDIKGEDRKDVKIYRLNEEPDQEAEWLSTTNESFRFGAVGRYIRAQFTEASEYEIR